MRLKLFLVPFSLLVSSCFLLADTTVSPAAAVAQMVADGDRFVMDDEAFDKAATLKAVALMGEGKLLTFTQLHGQKLSAEKLDFPPPTAPGNKVPPVELYEKLRKGMIAIGALYEDEETEEWTLSLSSGFAVAEGGIVSTCSHVMSLDSEQEGECYAVAVDSEGRVFPVLQLLADDVDSDTCLVKVGADHLVPLPLRPGAKAGEKAYCLSHPDGHYYMFTEGMVARVSRTKLNFDEADGSTFDKSRPTLSLEVTTEFSPGSSGGLIADEAGNVIAQVASITTEEGAGVVSARSCTAAEEIMRLANPGLRPKPDPLKLPPATLEEAMDRLDKTLASYAEEEDESKSEQLWKQFRRQVRHATGLVGKDSERQDLAIVRAQGLYVHGFEAGDTENAEEAREVLALLEAALSGKKLKGEERASVSHLRLMIESGLAVTLDDFDNWEKHYRRHLKNHGEDEDIGEVKTMLLDLAESIAVERLEAAATSLLQDPDPEIAADAAERLGKAKMMTEVRSKPLELTFKALDGSDVDLAQMRGKVVLLDFWATWCGPCMAEMPKVVEAYNQFKFKGFEIVGISLDEDREAVLKTVAKKKMTWPQSFDGKGWESPLAKRFNITALPTLWLINKQGVVVNFDAGGEGLKERIEKLLAE